MGKAAGAEPDEDAAGGTIVAGFRTTAAFELNGNVSGGTKLWATAVKLQAGAGPNDDTTGATIVVLEAGFRARGELDGDGAGAGAGADSPGAMIAGKLEAYSWELSECSPMT